MSELIPARVTVSVGFKANVGNYQSLHVELTVEDSVRSTDNGVDAAMERVYAYVEGKLMEKLTETRAELDKTGLV